MNDHKTLPTGIQGLDDLLGGGLPKGSLVEIIGKQITGKTSLALALTSSALAAGKIAFYMDTQSVVMPDHAEKMGLTEDTFLSCGGEKAQEMLSSLTQQGGVDLVCVDDCQGLVPNIDENGDLWAAKSAYMSNFIRHLNENVQKTGVTCVFTSRLRRSVWEKEDGLFNTAGPGAMMLNFVSGIRMDLTLQATPKDKRLPLEIQVAKHRRMPERAGNACKVNIDFPI